MVDVDGMVGRLVQLMEDAHLTMGLGGGGEDGVAEMLLRDHLRAGEGEEDAARGNLLKGLRVQAGITLQRVVQGTSMLGKGGRVKDDEVVKPPPLRPPRGLL